MINSGFQTQKLKQIKDNIEFYGIFWTNIENIKQPNWSKRDLITHKIQTNQTQFIKECDFRAEMKNLHKICGCDQAGILKLNFNKIKTVFKIDVIFGLH
jgi:hypothetical protein